MSLLEVEGLEVHFGHPPTSVRTLHGLNFAIEPGEIVGLVGESGSGKTVTSLALMGLLDPRAAKVSGRAVLDGHELWDASGRRASVRDLPMAMVFQEPMTALDPVFTIGSQLLAALKYRQGRQGKGARKEAIELLDAVGISDPAQRMRAYPHELSGGMRQRVMIAIALACAPKLLIADEPTTAVDVTIQAQLLELIVSLSEARGMSVLLVTHDLGVVAETCHRMITMYAGRVVEEGPVESVLSRPAHPYTAGLLAALPGEHGRGERLVTIPGRVPGPGVELPGCVFAPRCPHALSICETEPELDPVGAKRRSRCHRSEELMLAGAQL